MSSELRNYFEKNGYVYLKNILSKDVCNFLTLMLMRYKHHCEIIGRNTDDGQIPGAAAVMGQNIIFDTVCEQVWPIIESVIGEPIIPTYSYARLYKNGNELKKHTDRPSCEISFTLQLGRSHHYSWPIYAGGQRYDLAEGDAMLYKGCDIEHWRDPCDGPNDYYSGQVFCHYVRANGKYKEFAGDKRWQKWNNKIPFKRNRDVLMINK